MIAPGAALAIARCALLPGVCFGLVLATHARLSGTPPSYELWLYAARVALAAGLLLSACWLLVSAIDAHTRGWRALSGAALAALLAWPSTLRVAAHLASADGLRARGVAPALAESVFAVLLLAGPVLLWAYQRFGRSCARDWALSCLLLCALLAVDAWVGRVQVDLSALLQTFYALLLVAMLPNALARHPYWLRGIAVSSLVAVVGLGLVGWLQPLALARGRRRALVEESSLEFIERKLLLAPAPAPLPAQPPPAVCAALRLGQPLPELALAERARRNVVLISIDTLRADYARARIAGRPLMPHLQRFQGEARQARVAQTAYPATLLALSSAFRGLSASQLLLSPRLPAGLFAHARGSARVDEVRAVLPRGQYFTRPDVQRYLLDGADVLQAPGAGAQTDAAVAELRRLRAADRRHLLWIHYFEPHAPYQSWRGLEFGESDRQRHLSELAAVDRELGRLLSVLRDEGWYQDSLIILFADHGESFGERGHYYHHNLVYPWLIGVPFALRAPDGRKGVIAGPVQLADLTPTALHFLGAARLPYAMSGVSLLADDPPAQRALVSEEFAITGRVLEGYARAPLRTREALAERIARIERGPGYPSKLAITRDGYQLITHRGSGVVELYDARADPHAARDLAESATRERALLEREAERLRRRTLAEALCGLQQSAR